MPAALASARAAAALAKEVLARQRAARGRGRAAAAEAAARGAVRREEAAELQEVRAALAQHEEGAARAALLRGEDRARATVELAAQAAATRPRQRAIVVALNTDLVMFCVASYAGEEFGLVCESAAAAQIAVSRRRVTLVRAVEGSLHHLQELGSSCYLAFLVFRDEVERLGQGPARDHLLAHVVACQRIFSDQESALAALQRPAARSLGELHRTINGLEESLHLPLTPFVPLPARTPQLLPVAPVAPGPQQQQQQQQRPAPGPPPLWLLGAAAALALFGALAQPRRAAAARAAGGADAAVLRRGVPSGSFGGGWGLGVAAAGIARCVLAVV